MPVPAERMQENIGAQVQRARQIRGWTQQRLADVAGINRRTVVEIEKGSPTMVGTLALVLNELGLSLTVHGDACCHDYETRCRHCGAVAS